MLQGDWRLKPVVVYSAGFELAWQGVIEISVLQSKSFHGYVTILKPTKTCKFRKPCSALAELHGSSEVYSWISFTRTFKYKPKRLTLTRLQTSGVILIFPDPSPSPNASKSSMAWTYLRSPGLDMQRSGAPATPPSRYFPMTTGPSLDFCLPHLVCTIMTKECLLGSRTARD